MKDSLEEAIKVLQSRWDQQVTYQEFLRTGVEDKTPVSAWPIGSLGRDVHDAFNRVIRMVHGRDDLAVNIKRLRDYCQGMVDQYKNHDDEYYKGARAVRKEIIKKIDEMIDSPSVLDQAIAMVEAVRNGSRPMGWDDKMIALLKRAKDDE